MLPQASNPRERLLRQTIEWLLVHSAGDFTLRGLAADLDTSARMLVYHFGSRDGLLSEALAGVADHWMSGLRLPDGENTAEALGTLWRETLSRPEIQRLHLLSLEIWAMGLSSGNPVYRPFLDRVVDGWRQVLAARLVEDGMAPKKALVHGTLAVAAVEGLLLHRLTDDGAPVDEAFALFLKTMRDWTPPIKFS